MMKPDEELVQANERLKAEALELASAHEALRLELAEQKHISQALKGRVQSLRGLVGISADGYWEQDAEYRFTDFDGHPDKTKLDANRLSNIGKFRWDLTGAVPLDVSWEVHRAQLDAHQPFRNFEYQRESPEGQPIFLCISGEPLFDANDRFIGYHGVDTDITARKQTELALVASESRFRAVVAALEEGVVLRDAEGRIVECNANAERILGKTLAQIKGKTSAVPEWEMSREDGRLMSVEERPSCMARRTGLAQASEVVYYRRADGSVVWVQVHVQPLFGGDDPVPSGFVTTITDISSRKRAEIEVVRLNVTLENRVSRRTAQLEAANKELEAFSYSVAHDLRSPLGMIDGYCALMQKAMPTESGERAGQYINRIRAGVRRMDEITDGLLSLARLTRTSLSWDKVDLSAEAAKVIGQCAEKDAPRQVRAMVEPGLLVRADVTLLRQVLENLIGNAWKFTSQKLRAEITVGQEIGTDGEVVYFVRDNGAGFDMAYVDKLFGTFQRLHSPEEFAGSGIGLATVKRIIHRHGGRVWAASVLGECTTFYFTLGSDPGIAGAGQDGREEDARMSLALPRSQRLLAGMANLPAGRAAGVPISSDSDALLASDQQFSNVFEHAAIGMTLMSVDSRHLRINHAFCQMLGYAEEEMLSRTFRDITHPDDIAWDVSQRDRALVGEMETYNWEKRYIHKKGYIVWGHLTCSLVRDDDRKPLHFINQILDITERKEAERILRESSDALRLSERQLREITDTVPTLIAYVDVGQRFRFHNPACEEGFGLSGEQISGKTLREVMGEGFYQVVRARVDEVLSGYPVVYECTQTNVRGDQRDYVVNYFPRYGDGDESGQVIGFYSVATDITELKRIDRLKSEFVSTVSHELRTPLTSIRGSLGLIAGGVAGQLPEAVKTLVGIAKNNCERLIRLINDILDIEKIESGKMTLDVHVVELKPLMLQVLAANEGFGAAQNISLRLHCPEYPIRVQIDSDRLVQVATNLLSNAMKFSPPGAAVEVHVLHTGLAVRVEVRDQGPGIAQEFRSRIFQKFSQADSSDTRQKGGTGLGLNISRAIIERLGGSIGFDTEAGVGSTFFFELPEWKDPAPILPVPDRASTRPRVLICEDDHDIARLIGMMLDKGGFDSEMAYSAAQTQALLAKTSYAAMTVDLNLPDQDGITLIRTLRSQERTRELPIVVVSAKAGEGQMACNNQPLNVSDWLDKPIDENLLVLGVRGAIDGMAKGKPRILHVEDDLDIQRITAAIVQDFATFEFSTTLPEARARLLEQRFDLVVLDLALPGESGWDLFADIEALVQPPPVVVFSAREVSRAEGARAAAVLVKAQTSNEELLHTLQRVLSEGRTSVDTQL